MDINEIYKELDALKYPQIEPYLREKIELAGREGMFDIYIPLLNELIGFFRDSTQYDKGKAVKTELLQALDAHGQQGTMNYATSLLNIANFDRAAGEYQESLKEYELCESLYKGLLPAGDYLWAGLYNNKSLLYQEMGDNLAAIGALQEALYVVKEIPGRDIEVATTYVNIAQSFTSLGQTEEAKSNIGEALKIFKAGGNTDYHYSGALAVMGAIAYTDGEYDKAVSCYDKAADIVRDIMGENDNYRLLKQSADEVRKLTAVRPQIKIQGLDIARAYYEEYGKAMLHEKFPEYEDRIAVGLFGEGSDCMRLDDEISRDHDWGPGFMLLVRHDLYEKIGRELAKAYDELPAEYKGYKRLATAEGKGHMGVICIEDYIYPRLCMALPKPSDITTLYMADDPAGLIRREDLGLVKEEELSAITNGEVWRDDTGVITSVRDKVLEYYDDASWRHKLGVSLILTGQTGQYNLIRALKRGNRQMSVMYLSDYMKNAMRTLFLINRTYAPYDKWLTEAAGNLKIHPETADIMDALTDIYIEDMGKGIYGTDASDVSYKRINDTIEITAQIILQALKEINVIDQDEENWYMEALGKKLLAQVSDEKPLRDILVDKIIQLEWEAFDKVDSEGGRAFCQDDWTTFEIMRKSQYLEWNEPMLESFIADFDAANARGWNLITEKYGRMEKTTAPEEYAKIADILPPHTDEQDAIIEQIVAIQVGMMEEVAGKYPKLADNARTLHTEDDKPWDTSYETYLRGELGTYSETTLALYGMFIAELAKKGENLAYNIISNTARLYGYDSIEAAEASL